MFRLKRETASQKSRQSPVYIRGTKTRTPAAAPVLSQPRSHTWVRSTAADKPPVSTVPDWPAIPGVDVSSSSSRSFVSDSQASAQTLLPAALPQVGVYVSQKRNTLTRLGTGATSKLSAELKPAGNPTGQVNRETRRLIHQGRHKLVQHSLKRKFQQHSYVHPGRPSSAPTALQQYRRFVTAQNRKRAGHSLAAPAVKKANTWVRKTSSSVLTASPENAGSKNILITSCTSYVRSASNHKLQLVRQHPASLAAPSTPAARSQSRGSVLAKQLLSVRSLKRRKNCISNVKSPSILKPGRLQRIDGVLYKVGGSKHGRSLQRQLTPKGIKPLLSPEGGYVRQGRHSILKSMLKSPRVVGRRVSTARVSNIAAAVRVTARQKLMVRPRKPSRLRRSSQSSQTHCLVYCRTGQCREQQAGKCSLVHDQAAVAVCPRWLQGCCSNAACLLQHCRCPDVMPVCTFYLQGLCTTEDCPYAHVKVDPNAPVCQEFVAGHCPRGVACTKKHLTPRMIRQLRQSKALQASRHVIQQCRPHQCCFVQHSSSSL
ncbi:Zinc finger CCCH domain-containing protein 3, variant 2 [Trebouxia sp. C0009 RCD-2024]